MDKDLQRLVDRVACRLDKIAMREDISEEARRAIEYLRDDLPRLHVEDLNGPI